MITSIVVLILLVRIANYFGLEWRIVRRLNYIHYRYKRLKTQGKMMADKTAQRLLPEKLTIPQ